MCDKWLDNWIKADQKTCFPRYFGIKKQNHYNKYFIKILYSIYDSKI